jgi:superfamily II DNA or RNA helicase
MTLYDYQEQHLQRLLEIFNHHKVAIDCSITGAGKTIVAIHLAEEMIKRGINFVLIVCPPTLKEHWQSYVDSVNIPAEVVSSHSLLKIKNRIKNFGKLLLVVDECHLFKNNIQRTSTLKTISRNSEYALMLSATPYDDDRQFSNIKELFGITTDIKEHISKMEFEYSTKTEFNYQYVQLTDEEIDEYNKGYQTICYAVVGRNGHQNIFRPSVFTAGIQKIHDTLIEGCCEFIKKCLNEFPNHKFVVVLNFMRHFDYLIETLEEITPVLVLNGESKMTERHSIVSKFQQNDLEYRVIAISAEVGSVGIELDDKTGIYPRHMVCLPMTNAVNFCQAIGRIQRTKTKSNSIVSVIQPPRKVTYFKNQINRKFQVLNQFMNIPTFKDTLKE